MSTAGRPKGARNIKDTVDVEISRCPSCGSTERGEYTDLTVLDYAGRHNGKPYTSIERRPCQCLRCEQWRIDVSYPYEPSKWVGEKESENRI